MPNAKSKLSAARKTLTPRQRSKRLASYQRRVRAAGLVRGDDDPVPDNIDEFRLALARRIAMFINRWRGCPQRVCRRQRGCMAPNSVCSNQPATPPPTGEEWARISAQIQRALRAAIAQADGGK